MLCFNRVEVTPAVSSFCAPCSAFSRRPACLALSRPRSCFSGGGGEPPCSPRRPLPATLPPPVEPAGSSWACCLSCPGSYFSLPTRAGVLRPGRARDVSPTIWPDDFPRRPSPERPVSSMLFGWSLPVLPLAEKVLIGPSLTPQPAWSRLSPHAEVTSSA